MALKREIKFRAWDNQDNRMITHEQDFIPLKVTSVGVLRLDATSAEEKWHLLDGERFDLMQFTGRKDKKDVEIYEDDIIIDEEGRYGLVYWNPEESHFLVDFQADMEIEEISYYYVVCGNSWQNVELLK